MQEPFLDGYQLLAGAATNDFRSLKEDVFWAGGFQGKAVEHLRVEAQGEIAVRASPDFGGQVDLNIYNFWRYPGLEWGHYVGPNRSTAFVEQARAISPTENRLSLRLADKMEGLVTNEIDSEGFSGNGAARPRKKVSGFGILTLAVIGSLFTGHTWGKDRFTHDADRVLVIRNANSPISRAVAEDYAHRRSVHNIVTVACPDAATDALDETIDLLAYENDIEKPIREFLARHPGIDFIVLTKGIPIRLRGAGRGNGVEWFSLDSHLAALDYDKTPGAIRVDIDDPDYRAGYLLFFHRTYQAQAWANRFWNSTQPFSHREFGGYLVTRLDGFTEADARALTTRSLQAEQASQAGKNPQGEILLNMAPKFGFTGNARQPYSILPEKLAAGEHAKITSEKAHLGDLNSDMQLAAALLKSRGFAVELEETERFVGNRTDLMGYLSWGSNDPKFDAAGYHGLTFAPGALAETAVSSSARTFLPKQSNQSPMLDQFSQSLIADLISQGVTGAKGYTDEPLVQAIASPSILFDRYTRGWNLAESFYAASALVGWEDIVIGDPLTRAYRAAPR
jgi:hypothetical protein